jgi:hypothetical protein
MPAPSVAWLNRGAIAGVTAATAKAAVTSAKRIRAGARRSAAVAASVTAATSVA